MPPRQLTPDLYISEQPALADFPALAAQGINALICNRPDGEEPGQPTWAEMEAAAKAHGMETRFIPVTPDTMNEAKIADFADAMAQLPKPVLAYCRTGNRSTMLAQKAGLMDDTGAAIAGAANQSANAAPSAQDAPTPAPAGGKRVHHRIVIVGGGSGGISVASSLLKRQKGLDIAIIEPATQHYYQPGWTMVGGGVFRQGVTCRPMGSVIPRGVSWIRQAAAGFAPEDREVILHDGSRVCYDVLIVAVGNCLDWGAVAGLPETLGRNGVTSNYHYSHAPYTWQMIQSLNEGRALFTQPPMPIKCAGAPQKAMYLACSKWEDEGRLSGIDVQFHNAGAVLFGVPDYVPALQKTADRYGISHKTGSNLVAVDGQARQAVFKTETGEKTLDFAMLHICPPQKAHPVVAGSAIADSAGYAEVDPLTLRHTRYSDIFALGDGCNTPNAKTAAAVRQQAPVVAENVLAVLNGHEPEAGYDGYGSCPLTVERGKIVLAEFTYGGKVAPTFPLWLIEGTRPTRTAWLLKEKVLPAVYWQAMLKGHELLAKPKKLADVTRPSAG